MIFNFANDWSAFNKLGNSYDRRKQMADNALNDVKLLADSTDNVIKEYKTDKLWDEVNNYKTQSKNLKDMESKYAQWQKEEDAKEAAWNAQQDAAKAEWDKVNGPTELNPTEYQPLEYREGMDKEAVKNIQRKIGATPDGIWGPQSDALLSAYNTDEKKNHDLLNSINSKRIGPDYQRQAYERPEYEGLQDLEAQRLVVGDNGDDYLWDKALQLKRYGDSTLYDEMVAQRTRQEALADKKADREHEIKLKEMEKKDSAYKNMLPKAKNQFQSKLDAIKNLPKEKGESDVAFEARKNKLLDELCASYEQVGFKSEDVWGWRNDDDATRKMLSALNLKTVTPTPIGNGRPKLK